MVCIGGHAFARGGEATSSVPCASLKVFNVDLRPWLQGRIKGGYGVYSPKHSGQGIITLKRGY